ncbi:kinase-like domain-containing protein [Lipomyces japonicus]|uniref:kinase-like domain-containing protein n=1 Tax=Lipomyces japonicus TaxID=56871 RepID=UPI0034CDAC3E
MTTSLQEHYEALELIGRGTFGQIRKVRHRMDGHLLVRKEISYSRMSQREKTQLLAELRILKALRHANIVQYVHHERVQESEEVHLYMEFCGGGDLAQLIKTCRESGQLVPERVVWSIITQLVLALYRCHHGMDPPPLTDLFAPPDDAMPVTTTVILHRDIKPENIFLDAENNVKLGDFGLSKMLDSEHSLATTYVGTPYYMSPEVLLDQPYTPQSDIWSLGCVIYELCALQPPFSGKSHMQLAQKIREGKFAPIPGGYSLALQRIISSCLTLTAQKRPTTHSLLQTDLIMLHRREREMVEMHKILRSREEAVITREQELVLKEREFQESFESEKSRYESEIRLKLQEELEGLFRDAVEAKVMELMETFQPDPMASDDAVSTEMISPISYANEHSSTPKSTLSTRHSMSDLRHAYSSSCLISSPADIPMSYSPFPNASPLGTFPTRQGAHRTPTRSRLAQEMLPTFSPSVSPIIFSKPNPLKAVASAPVIPTTNSITPSSSSLSSAATPASSASLLSNGTKRKSRNYATLEKQPPLHVLPENDINTYRRPATSHGGGIGLGAAAARAKIMTGINSKHNRFENKIPSSNGGIGRTIIDIQRQQRKMAGNNSEEKLWLAGRSDSEDDLPSPFLKRWDSTA